MPQFDLLSLGAQIFGLLISFSYFYYYNIKNVIPLYVEAKKFRNKKLLTGSLKIKDVSYKFEKIIKEDLKVYTNLIC